MQFEAGEDGEPTDSLIVDAKESIKTAAVTKCTGCLMMGFDSKIDLETLRSKVQSEIRELRSYSVKEAEVLHPVVMARVSKALALKT